MKPKASYKNRMTAKDDTWLIWSNKWNCWYRSNSSGYTSDIAQAGLYDRETAMQHYDGWPSIRKHRDTEPFPISAVRKHIMAEKVKLLVRHDDEMAAINAKTAALLNQSAKP